MRSWTVTDVILREIRELGEAIVCLDQHPSLISKPALGNTYNRLFRAIHPGENIGLVQLKMEEERHGSVSQSGVFHGHNDVPPQAAFSESHLDTLGFCVWLALAKRESAEQTVLLIDDIFSSVDRPASEGIPQGYHFPAGHWLCTIARNRPKQQPG
jgi:hypothetical protein